MSSPLIKPFTQPVDANGHAVLDVTHSLHGKQWKVYQLGFGLGKPGTVPQVAAMVNGQPLASTVIMQPSVFVNIPGQPPYAVQSFMVGPPYIILQAGDRLTCGVTGATAGDTFTVTAFLDEFDTDEIVTMGN